jgi:hypothetical protein
VPISSLVLTLADDPSVAEPLLMELRRDPRFTIGERFGNDLPVVIESADRDEECALLEALFTARGLSKVDVVFVEVMNDAEEDAEDVACHKDP